MTEEDAFWTFATLMKHCGLVGLFSDGFPLLFQVAAPASPLISIGLL